MLGHEMKIYEASIELNPRFDDRRAMFITRATGNTRDYDKYKCFEDRLIQIIFDALNLVRVDGLAIFYNESFDDQSELFDSFSSDGLITRRVLNKTFCRIGRH